MAALPAHKRLLSIDLLRGVAVLVMIETHVVGLMLRADVRATVAFDILDLVNGLVAPCFLFAAGFATVLSTFRPVTTSTSNRARLKNVGVRIASIWALGYLLRLPGFTPGRLLQASAADWMNFIAVDVLQCIALGWVLLFALRHACRSERLFRYATLAVTLLFLFGAAPIWSIDLTARMPVALAAYFNAQTLSLFPLFPWLTFMAGGAWFGLIFRKAHEAGRADATFNRAGWIGLGVALLAYAFLYFFLEHMAMAWEVNPAGLTMRFGLVFFLTGLANWWGRRLQAVSSRFGEMVLQVGRHSLPVYALHLLFLYRAPWGETSVPVRWGGTLGFGGALTWALVLCVAMIAVAYAWPKLRVSLRQMRLRTGIAFHRFASLGTGGVLVLLFFVIGACAPPASPSDNYWVASFHRAEARNVLRVAYLGASVTCGQRATDVWTQSYVALVNTWLEKRSGVAVDFTNYCVGSARSLTGLVQMKQVALNNKPDLILAEFGILDGAGFQPSIPANEAMIRLAHAEGIPFLMVATATSDSEATSRSRVLALGRHYGLPVADMQSLMEERGLPWSVVSIEGDRWHPNDRGHALLAESITLALESVLTGTRAVPTVLPDPYSMINYTSAVLLEGDKIHDTEASFERAPSDVFKQPTQALRLKEQAQSGTLHFSFEGPVLGVLYTHDAVPTAFTYAIDDQPALRVTPPLWQKDHLLTVDLAPGPHKVILTVERGQGPVSLEGILIVPDG